MNDWNTKARDYFNGDIVADWNNNVDITEEHAEESKVTRFRLIYPHKDFYKLTFRKKIPSSKNSLETKLKKPKNSFATLSMPASKTSPLLTAAYKINLKKMSMIIYTSQ